MTINRQINERMRRHLAFPRVVDASSQPIAPILSKIVRSSSTKPRFAPPYFTEERRTKSVNTSSLLARSQTFDMTSKIEESSNESGETWSQELVVENNSLSTVYGSGDAESTPEVIDGQSETLDFVSKDELRISQPEAFSIQQLGVPELGSSLTNSVDQTNTSIPDPSIDKKNLTDSFQRSVVQAQPAISAEQRTVDHDQIGIEKQRGRVFGQQNIVEVIEANDLTPFLPNNRVDLQADPVRYSESSNDSSRHIVDQTMTDVPMIGHKDTDSLLSTRNSSQPLTANKQNNFSASTNSVEVVRSNSKSEPLVKQDDQQKDQVISRTGQGELQKHLSGFQNSENEIKLNSIKNDASNQLNFNKSEQSNLENTHQESHDDSKTVDEFDVDSVNLKESTFQNLAQNSSSDYQNRDKKDVADDISFAESYEIDTPEGSRKVRASSRQQKVSGKKFETLNSSRENSESLNEADFTSPSNENKQGKTSVIADRQIPGAIETPNTTRGLDGSSVFYDVDGNDIVVFNPPRFPVSNAKEISVIVQEMSEPKKQIEISEGQLESNLISLVSGTTFENPEIQLNNQLSLQEIQSEQISLPTEFVQRQKNQGQLENIQEINIQLAPTIDAGTAVTESINDLVDSLESASILEKPVNASSEYTTTTIFDKSTISDARDGNDGLSEKTKDENRVEQREKTSMNAADVFVVNMPLPPIPRPPRKARVSNVPEKNVKKGEDLPQQPSSNNSPEFKAMFEEMMMIRRAMAGLPPKLVEETNTNTTESVKPVLGSTKLIPTNDEIVDKAELVQFSESSLMRDLDFSSAFPSQIMSSTRQNAVKPEKVSKVIDNSSFRKPTAIAKAFFAQLSNIYGQGINTLEPTTNLTNDSVDQNEITDLRNGAELSLRPKTIPKIVESTSSSESTLNSTASQSLSQNQRSSVQLSESSRQFLKPLTGIDSNDVRIERNEQTQQITKTLQADALTVGDTILLSDRLMTETPEMLGIVAHELTHVARNRDARFVPPIAQGTALGQQDEESIALQVESQVRAFVEADQKMRGISSTTQDAANFSSIQSRDLTPEQEQNFGDMPAPWELPDWMQNSALPIPNGTQPNNSMPTVNVPAQPMPVIPAPMAEAPSFIQAAAQNRNVPANAPAPGANLEKRPAENEAGAGAAPAPDLDELAQQVYRRLKRRIAEEQRRQSF